LEYLTPLNLPRIDNICLKLENILNQILEELTHKTLIQILLSVASTIMTGLTTGELSILKTNLLLKTKTESTHNQILEAPTHKMPIQTLLSLASTTMTGLMTGEPSTLRTNPLLKTQTKSTHNQTSEEQTHRTLIQIPLSAASTTMTGPTTGELSTLRTNPSLNPRNILNQILEEPTHRTLIQTPLSAASTTTTGPTTGELSISKTKLSLKPSQTQTTSLQPSQLNIQDQISEDKTHRTPTLTALSLPTYTTTGLTTGITTSIERETIEMMTISCLTSITSSSKLMLKNIQDQTSEAKTHRTLTPISLSLPTYTTTGPTTGTTTSTERETIETMMISCSISTTNSDW